MNTITRTLEADTALPTPATLAGEQSFRLRGIESWEQVALLGRANLERLLELGRLTVNATLTEGGSRAELVPLRQALDILQNLLASAPEKPLLPRLRAESFRKGDALFVYVADTEGQITGTDWVPATLTAVEKSFKAEWKEGRNTGYYWRLTATADRDILPGVRDLPFSTSEPRIVTAWEYHYLSTAATAAPEFLALYRENARRAWPPIWCLERNLSCGGERIPLWQAE